MKSYDVKFWAIRPGKAKTKRTYEVRWKVGPVPHSRSLTNRAQADNFLSELRQAARKGEPFDTDTGLPDSMAASAGRERSWLAFCLAYTDMKWPSAAPKTRDALTDALATLIPALTSEPAPDGIDSAAYLPKITVALMARGYTADDMKKLLGGNLLRVFAAVQAAAEKP